MVQLSYPYMPTGKTIALTIQTFVGKVMSLLFNMLSSFVRAFQVVLVVKNLTVNAGDVRDSRFNRWVRRYHGGGHGNPLQYSCLENSMDR